MRLFQVIFLCGSFLAVGAQNLAFQQADSLFDQQKYTEAFELYQNIYNDNQASSAMLLKMAFIEDGLGNYPEALFYLDQYYIKSADRQVIGKIEELAEANSLRGFKYDDTDYFSILLKKYKGQLLLLFTALALMLGAYVYRKSKEEEEKPFAAGILQFMLVALILLLNNLDPSPDGIIMYDNTLLRSGPSAGAEPVEIISRGHKMKVIDQDEVWSKVLWDGQEVYIRNGRIKVI